MGANYKVYLTDVENEGLELLQKKVKEAGGNGAANALFKDALRSYMLREGVLEYAPPIGENAPLLRVARPPVAEVVPERTRRRRVRRG